MEYLVRFAQVHETFRLPELRALAALNDIRLEIVYYKDTEPFAVVRLADERAAKTLIKRSILAQCILELWGSGMDYDALRDNVKQNFNWLPIQHYAHSSFRFKFDGYRGKRSDTEQRHLIESFDFLGLQGPIKMTNAELQLRVLEYFDQDQIASSAVYLARWIADGNREAVAKLNLKQRKYIGLTSMDAELSLVTANMTNAAPGKIIYDPFVGTGSFSVACAYFGAAALGSDIDGRAIRGTPSCNHLSNYTQYDLASNLFDNFIADLTNTPLRITPWLDGIICDPPYGVREAPKVLGYRDDKDTTPMYLNGVFAHMRPGYIPPKRPYGFDDILQDVLEFAAITLVPNGRLSLWMPTANDEDVELALPISPGLELVNVCVQNFNKWARRLLTYRRVPGVSSQDLTSQISRKRAEKGKADDLNRFRKKYFQGFRGPENEAG